MSVMPSPRRPTDLVRYDLDIGDTLSNVSGVCRTICAPEFFSHFIKQGYDIAGSFCHRRRGWLLSRPVQLNLLPAQPIPAVRAEMQGLKLAFPRASSSTT